MFLSEEISARKGLTVKIFLPVVFLIAFNLPSGSDTEKKIISDTADQIHFSIISATAVTFDWVGTADHIIIGSKPRKLKSIIMAEHPSFLPVTSPWQSDPGPYWESKLMGLKQNTIYYYKIGESGKVHEFKTPPLPGTADFRVCLTSDIHESSKECLAMFSQIAGLKPDLVLSTGDLTGAGPDGQKNVAERFHDAMVWSQDAAWMPVWGNHDWEYDTIDDLRSYKGRFDIPNPGTITGSPAISCCGEDWGWFDYGNTRFISLPEPWTSSTRVEWESQVTRVFSDAQNDQNIKFIVTFGHRSAYTSTTRRSPGEIGLRTILNRLNTKFPKYKLDLSGHNHQYERYLLTNGMTYIVNSSTGSYYHEGWQTPVKPVECAYRAIHYGILVLDISENAISGRFVCSANSTQHGADYMPLEEPLCSNPGEVIDAFKITSN
jgi:hypothetical protein